MGSPGAERRRIQNCPVCGAAERSPWLDSLGFPLVRCDACGHRYAAEVLGASALAGEYYDEPDADIAARSLASKRARFIEVLPLIQKVAPKPGRVLDVGCNAGEWLELFQGAGWEVAGVEASPGPAAYARARLGAPIWEGPAEEVIPEREHFGLVTMMHVLEHVEGPGKLLGRLYRALAPGGAILIEVPNADDGLLRVFGGFYRPLCPGDHVSFFDERSLRRVLEGAGFDVVDVISPVHARDLVYGSALSAVDWARSLARRARQREQAPGQAEAGVMAQTRYRGRFRAPIRKVVDRLVKAIDPAVVGAARAASSGLAEKTGPVLIALGVRR
jgi:SAM-dependent methyltransferase